MKVAVVAETDAGEPRVAAVPETVKKMIGLGAEVAVEPGAGRQIRRSRCGLHRGRRHRVRRRPERRRRRAPGAPPARRRAVARQERRHRHRHHGPLRQRRGAARHGGCRHHQLRHGASAAHHPRAGHGRAVEPGQSRRLPRRDRCRGRIRPRAADDDDGGRHRAGHKSFRHGRRRRRPAGDRHRAPSRRHRHRHRRAAGGQGTGREPRRQIHRRRGRGIQGGRDCRRLRQGNVERVSGETGRAGRRAHQEAGHRHHHRAHSRPAGAAADHIGHGDVDAAGLGGGRSRGRARRQCRRRQCRRGERAERRQSRRLSQRAGPARRHGLEPLLPRTSTRFWKF